MLGHELRNPLSTITAGVSLLSAPTISDASRTHAIDAIRRQSGLLTNIVDELLVSVIWVPSGRGDLPAR